jgi:hypothetical protein
MIYVYRSIISIEKRIPKKIVLLLVLLRGLFYIGLEGGLSQLNEGWLYVLGFMLDLSVCLLFMVWLLAAYSKDRVIQLRTQEKSLSNKS